MIADQFPTWIGLPLVPVASPGTDNVMLRLGETLIVRLPRIASALPSLAKEARYAPMLGAHLPIAVPVPLAEGVAGRGYPWHWAISRWLEGENPLPGHTPGTVLVWDLAHFILALHSIDVGSESAIGPLSSYRGGPLAEMDEPTRSAIARCAGLLDVSLLTSAWDTARQVPSGDGKPVWIHTDLQPGNILITDARLRAVLAWGGLAIGDRRSISLRLIRTTSARTKRSLRSPNIRSTRSWQTCTRVPDIDWPWPEALELHLGRGCPDGARPSG